MKQLIPAFIQEQLIAGKQQGALKAFALNVDLSGFTQLTEGLMRMGAQGAETLSQVLNEIFEPLVTLMYARGGFIPYFAGDAFTAIFPFPQDSLHAKHLINTAQEAQRIFQDRGYRFGGSYTIGIKAGIGSGMVEYGIVGQQSKSFYFRGSAIEQAANCQSHATEGSIVIDQFTKSLIQSPSLRCEEIHPHCYRLRGNWLMNEPLSVSTVHAAIDPAIAIQFLPETLVKNEPPGEFRTVITLFIAFDNLHRGEQLADFAQLVLSEASDFGAYFKEIDFGDKGGLMAVFFGAPVGYENSMTRALEFALNLQDKSEQLRLKYPAFCFRIGMSMGTAFTGLVGGLERCQYACVGNRVNLAVRIMSSAAWNEILTDDSLANANAGFRFAPKGATTYKGISEPVLVYTLIGRRLLEGKPNYERPMIAREKELEIAKSCLQQPKSILYVYGEAGIGKSRFTFELQNQLKQAQGSNWLICPCDQILRKPFNPFLYCLRRYFQQANEQSPAYNQQLFEQHIARLAQQLQQLNKPQATHYAKELERTQPILSLLLGLENSNSLWEQLDARGRYQNTLAAIINLFQAENELQPLVLELEDIHWIDEDSKVLLQSLLRQIEDAPIRIVCTARLFDNGEKPLIAEPPQLLELQITAQSIDLEALDTKAVTHFATQQLGGAIHPEFLEVLLKASNSNPFYIEQLLAYFQENSLLIHEHGVWNLHDKNIKLSNSITAILTARIDRLSEMVRETVKAAAVIGREFDIPVLTEVLCHESVFRNAQGDTQHLLKEQIALAEQGQIWSAMNELRYIFRHSLMREVAYSMQLNTRLQQLHAQIAEAIEKIYAHNLGEHFIDLVFHFEQAGNTEKTIRYLYKAADYARANFQNQQALDFYDRLIAKLAPEENQSETLKIVLKKGSVLELIGQWEAAQLAYEHGQLIAKKNRDIIQLGRAHCHLGQLLTLRGRYDEAMQHLQIAANLFDSIDDMLGIAKVNSSLGNLFFRRARYDEAEQYYKKALETGISESGTTSSAQTVGFLGLTYMNRGQYEAAIRLIQEQIPLHAANNNYAGLASLRINLGIVFFESGAYNAAKIEYEQGLELADRLGNKHLAAIGIGCLGTVLEKQGLYEEAMQLYEQDLKVCKELGDWQGIAIAEGLLGELFNLMGQFQAALPHLQQSLRISKELGYQKGVAKAVNALGDLHYWQANYPQALAYYDEAILTARKTNNRLVLASSLMEKSMVLLEMDEAAQLETTVLEATSLAESLGNPELSVDTQLLQARILARKQDFHAALTILQNLLHHTELPPDQEAAIYYERFRISEKDVEARDLARALYEQLYAESPKFLYQIRCQELRAKTV